MRIFIMENFGCENSDRLAGSGRNPELLHSLKKDSLKSRCGCAMHFKKEPSTTHYIGCVEPGNKCFVPRDGKLTYLVSEVELGIEVEFKDIARKKAPTNTLIFLKLKLLFFTSKIKSMKNNSPIIIIK